MTLKVTDNQYGRLSKRHLGILFFVLQLCFTCVFEPDLNANSHNFDLFWVCLQPEHTSNT